MNSTVKFVLTLSILTALVIAIGAIVWRVHLVHDLGVDLRPRPLGGPILLAVPAILAAVYWAAERQFAAFKPGISEAHPREAQATLVLIFPFVVACQAWMGFMYVGARPPASETLIRVAVIVLGVAILARGERLPKLGPLLVDGELAAPGWTRAALRTGWISVAAGAGLVAGAIFLPLKALFWLCLASAPLLIGAVLLQRRAIHPTAPQRKG